MFLLSCLSALSVFGQQFSYLGIENGLSNNTVTSIHKDKFGLMWFGTLDGLNRYDGYHFQVFRKKYGDTTSLPNDQISIVTSDSNGNIWVGTHAGIGVLDNATLTFTQIAYLNNQHKRINFDNWVYDVKQNIDGKMLIGTFGLGLMTCEPNSAIAHQLPLIIKHKKNYNYTVTAISPPNKNGVWVTVDGVGLCYYNRKDNVLQGLNAMLPTGFSILQDHKNELWIGTGIGMYHYLPRLGQLSKYAFKEPNLSATKFTGLIIDKSDFLWATTDGEGIVKVDLNNQSISTLKQSSFSGLTSNAIYTLFEDELSRKWIGTLRGGVNIIDEKKNQFRTYANIPLNPNSLVNNFTFSFCEDNEKNVWIGTDGGGLSIWNRKLNFFKNYVNIPGKSNTIRNNYITSIVKDDEGEMWLSSFGTGVSRFSKKANSFVDIPFDTESLHHSVWKLIKDQRDIIWATCLKGDGAIFNRDRLFFYNKDKGKFVPAPFDVKNDIVAITDDGPDKLWLGSFNGLLHADKKSGVDQFLDLQTTVRSLHLSSNGILWIGTYGKGLLAYSPNLRKYVTYNEEKGLCNNKVLNIEEDKKGSIWVSTNNGISKLIPATGKIENFYATDGLQSNQFYFNASTSLSSGEIIFGGIKGFNVFYPDSIRQYHDFPPLILTGLRIANTVTDARSEYAPDKQSIYTIDKLRLPYDKAIISLDYVALEYSLPEKIQYSYYLEGRDRSWNNVGNQRTVNYSHLNEGHYTLKLRSTNASGIWNKHERWIDIEVLPPWYRTWWAYFLYLATVGSSLYAYLFYLKKQTQFEYEVKLAKELNEKKISFFTNISHELRTPLTLIVNPIKELLHSNGTNLDLVDISAVYRNSRRLLSLVDQLLLFRSSENELSAFQPDFINLKEVVYEVFLCFTNQVKAKNIKYSFECLTEDPMIYGDREKIEIILFNLLSNAIKYTPDQGSVNLSIQSRENFFAITVADNGRGIPQETGEKLFEKFHRLQSQNDNTAQESGFGIGLFLAKKYTELHHGRLTYQSQVGAGTTFTLLLPAMDANQAASVFNKRASRRSGSLLLNELVADAGEAAVLPAERVKVDAIMDDIVNKKPAILLIDDDFEMRNYIKILLKDDYITYEADNTEAGFKIVLECEPDIIVCDVVMRGMSGVEFCSKLKESPTFSHIPVILLTGSSSPEIKLKGIECGADDYITKPFESELLIARIKSMLKKRDTLKNYFFNEITLKNNSQKIPAEYSEFLSRCIAIVEKHMQDELFDIKKLTDEIGMSRSKLFRKIKSISGLSSSEFIRYIRLRKAAEMMIQTDMQIKEIAFRVGFQDIKYFREQFYKLFEMNPSEFIKKYRHTFSVSHHLNSGVPAPKSKN